MRNLLSEYEKKNNNLVTLLRGSVANMVKKLGADIFSLTFGLKYSQLMTYLRDRIHVPSP
jgi:hypothetical protein